MGFVGGFLILFFMLIGFLGLATVVGIIIVIVSVVKRRKARREGRIPRNVGLVTGLVILSIPINAVLLVAVTGSVSNVKKQIARQSYDCYMDKWRNESVSESTAREEVIDEFLKAADEGDTEEIKLLFSQTIQESSRFDKQLEEFMEEYPGGLSEIEYEVESGGAGGGSDSEGMWSSFGASCEITTDENTYYIRFSAKLEDTANPENVGLTCLTLYSEEVEALRNSDGYVDESENLYIYSKTRVDGVVNARKIGGTPWKYTEYDRTITAEQAKSVIQDKSGEYQDLANVIDEIGEPNAMSYSSGSAYYELAHDDDESTEDPYYVWICFDKNYGRIYDAYFVYGEDGNIVDWDNNLTE